MQTVHNDRSFPSRNENLNTMCRQTKYLSLCLPCQKLCEGLHRLIFVQKKGEYMCSS